MRKQNSPNIRVVNSVLPTLLLLIVSFVRGIDRWNTNSSDKSYINRSQSDMQSINECIR